MSGDVIELAPYIERRRRRAHFDALAGLGLFLALAWMAWRARAA